MELDPSPGPRRQERDDSQEQHAAMPRCPNCGWQDVRISRSKGAIDSVLGALGVLPFRCRSCSHRFYRAYRKHES